MPILKPFLWGLGAAALAYIMMPKVKKMAKPIIVKGVSGAMGLTEKGREVVKEFKDRRRGKDRVNPSDTKTIYDTSIEQMRQEEIETLNEIKELKSMIFRLQDEINEIKQKNQDK